MFLWAFFLGVYVNGIPIFWSSYWKIALRVALEQVNKIPPSSVGF